MPKPKRPNTTNITTPIIPYISQFLLEDGSTCESTGSDVLDMIGSEFVTSIGVEGAFKGVDILENFVKMGSSTVDIVLFTFFDIESLFYKYIFL